MHHSSSRASRRGFTLVELLVVIGIIAILISVLLPALAKARSRGQTVSCASNLHQITLAALMYAAEHKGSLPFGFVFNRMNYNYSTDAGNGRPAGDTSYITWFSSCDKYMTAKSNYVIPLDRSGNVNGYLDGGTSRRFAKAFRCPSVPDDFNQQVTYANHPVAMPHIPDELDGNPANGSNGKPHHVSPLKTSQLYPENALFWDTYVNHDQTENSPSGVWWNKGSVGANLPASMIDDRKPATNTEDGLLCHPEHPERRFRGPTGDRFATSQDQTLNPNGPVCVANDQWLADLGYPYSMNTDYGNTLLEWNSGNCRWRHNGNKSVNVAFQDGSVRTLNLNPRKGIAPAAGTTATHLFLDNEFKRYMLMTKWPPKFKDSGYNG